MAYHIGSILLYLAGIAAAACVIILGFQALGQKTRSVFFILLYMGISLVFGAAMVRNFWQTSSPHACAQLPGTILAGSGAILLIHVYFIWDILKSLPKRRREEEKD